MAIHPSPEEHLGQHVKYEIDMLRETLLRLQRLSADADQVIVNALIESYCTHARGLIEFLREQNGKKKRTARYYVNRSYEPFKGKTRRVNDLNVKLNQQVSHLCLGRTADSAKKIDDVIRAELYELIREAMAHFKGCLKPEHRTIEIGQLSPVPPATNQRPITTTNTVATTHSSLFSRPVSGAGPSSPRGK